MRRRYQIDRPLNPLEQIIAKRHERLRLAALCNTGEVPWAVYDKWVEDHYPNRYRPEWPRPDEAPI